MSSSFVKQESIKEQLNDEMSDEEKALRVAQFATQVFQNMEQNSNGLAFSRFEKVFLERFLGNVLKTRNDAYKTPQFWYLRQGRK